MKQNKYQEEMIKKIALSCNHSKESVKNAVESYIADQDRHYGELSIGNLKVSVILDNHYDESTGALINDDWQTTITIMIVCNNVEVSFD